LACIFRKFGSLLIVWALGCSGDWKRNGQRRRRQTRHPQSKLPASAATGWEFVWFYRLIHEGPVWLNAEEISGGDWFTPAAIDAWIGQGGAELTRSFQVIWQRFRGLGSG